MICFGAKTDQEVKENGYMGPTQINNKKKRKIIRREEREVDGEGSVLIFIFIFFLSHFSL